LNVVEEEFDGRHCIKDAEILEVWKVNGFQRGPPDCFGQNSIRKK
jgi:hypothetical protein